MHEVQRRAAMGVLTMSTIAQHDACLRKAGLPSVETLTRRILRVFDRATASDIEEGSTWYSKAHEVAINLGYYSGRGTAAAAAVISHLSPRTPWSRNVAGAIGLMIYGEPEGCIGANVERARGALDTAATRDYGADLVDTFNGPKTRRFYLNIMGDVESVTIDVWALRVADVEEWTITRKGVYDAVEIAYQRAARRRGVAPATMQATTWVVARNGRAS